MNFWLGIMTTILLPGYQYIIPWLLTSLLLSVHMVYYKAFIAPCHIMSLQWRPKLPSRSKFSPFCNIFISRKKDRTIVKWLFMTKNMNYITYTAIVYSSKTLLSVFNIIFCVKDSQCNLKTTMHSSVSNTFDFIVQLDPALFPLFADYTSCV